MADAMRAKARRMKSSLSEPAASNVASRHKPARHLPLQITSIHHDTQARCLPLQMQHKTAAPEQGQARSGRKGWRHNRAESTTQHRLLTLCKHQLTLKLHRGEDLSSTVYLESLGPTKPPATFSLR
ncbi:Hypothetical predicted protein [Pelobates cultripes]|uniref:Uncharacterized protein n=1 Tax=Pelobates cultripes TaxID=61616 RepID=A0AAD1RD67_PELCU|nr:Hypothetical predicted protein [Pelobates cultripes]